MTPCGEAIGPLTLMDAKVIPSHTHTMTGPAMFLLVTMDHGREAHF